MSIADISYICDVTVLMDVFGVDITEIAPGITAWAERMKTALPEYEELIAKPVAGFKEMIAAKTGRQSE